MATDVRDASDSLSISDYTVLGMVGLGARSGYEIKQVAEVSIRFFWTISQVQIYPSLRRLEAAGLLLGRSEPRGRRPRRVFELTPAGLSELHDWLRRPEPMPFELRDVGMVKLFFADALPPAQGRELLAAVIERSEERVAALEAIEPVAAEARAEGQSFPELTLLMGLAFHRALIEVCQEFALRQA